MAEYIFYTNDDFINNPVTGGTRRFRELVTGLLERGHRIHLFIPGHAIFPEHKNLIRYPLRRKTARWLPNGLLNFVGNYRQWRHIQSMERKRLVLISVPYAIQAVLAGLRGYTLILWEDFPEYRQIGLESRGYPNYLIRPLWLLWRLMERWSLKYSGRIIVQCRYDRDVLLKRHPRLAGFLRRHTLVLPNNVNPSWIRQFDSTAGSKFQPRVNSEHWDIGFIGNLDDRRKGLHILLRAFVRLMAESFSGRLHVMGGGRLLPFYQNRYQEDSSIVFYGHVKAPSSMLSQMDLLVVPSLSDSFPNTVMEALYLGIPVLGARKGGIPEMLHYETLLFEPDPNHLYNRLKSLLRPGKFETLHDLCARRRQDLEFDWVGSMEKILQ